MDYKKLIKDTNDGLINWKEFRLIIDNDSGYWCCLNPFLDESSKESKEDKMSEIYGTPDGYDDFLDILEIIGINADWS